jgi:SAM-dependent methyltransferase
MSVGLSKRWFAWAMHHMAERYDALLADRKRDLLGSLEGTIVEIGPGTGTNFRYYSRGVQWIGVEPNPYMHPYLRRAGMQRGSRLTSARTMQKTWTWPMVPRIS